MKNLIFINGTMGVGKTSTCNELKKMLSKSVFLDGDWCWDMTPFIVNEETKKMVIDNITHLLNNFLHNYEFENIIFCWVMHEQEIINDIISKLDVNRCQLYTFSLICSENALLNRITKDIDKGIRKRDIIDRTLSRLKNYLIMPTIKIDVSDITAVKAAAAIKERLGSETHGL